MAAFPWMRRAADAYSVDVVLEMVDKGLYLAKQRGRNRSVGLLAREESFLIDPLPAFNAHESHDAQLFEVSNLAPSSTSEMS